MEIIERVARALCAANDLDPDAPQVVGDCESGKFWQFHVTEARAAIAAMREPEREMLMALRPLAPKLITRKDVVEQTTGKTRLEVHVDFGGVWRAMIDAILTPAPNPTATTEDGGER